MEAIEEFIQDRLKAINRDKLRRTGIINAWAIGHYKGVIDGQETAYNAVLSEIKRLMMV